MFKDNTKTPLSLAENAAQDLTMTPSEPRIDWSLNWSLWDRILDKVWMRVGFRVLPHQSVGDTIDEAVWHEENGWEYDPKHPRLDQFLKGLGSE
jgi:hypothetical protein